MESQIANSAEDAKAQLEALQALRAEIKAENPLTGFHACPEYCGSLDCPEPSERNPTGGRPKQHEFMAAPEFIVASNAGNRFGKTTAMVVWSIIQHTPDELVPERLRAFKRAKSKVVQGRYMLPSEEALEDTILPVFKLWCPKSILRGGAWEKSYRKAPGNTIHFADGGKLSFHTYKQDAAMLAGWSGDYVLWDEPPPESHWREGGPIRVMDRNGCHRFGMTPVNMQGGGIGWVKRKIFDRGNPNHPEHNPNIRIVRASIWDNPDYSKEQIEQTLSEYPEDERQAREFGDFIHFGGMIYPGGFEGILRKPIDASRVEGTDIVVGIDPGVKNAAFVWVSFDRDNIALVFDELLLQEKTVLDYARAIRQINSKWGVNPLYVIDPSARNRHGINLEDIQGELLRLGIPTINGYNPVQAGVQNLRRRIQEKGLFVTENCQGLRGEADEYRMEDRPDGEFKVVKENDHRLDALRYAVMSRPWTPVKAYTPGQQVWEPGKAPPQEWFDAYEPPFDGAPMGSFS